MTLNIFRPGPLFVLSSLLRAALLLYGLYQDANSALKYTDIDYLVFTDAAHSLVVDRSSPYDRATYRYTPLLAWILAPTALSSPLTASSPALSVAVFSLGKVLFALADLAAGWLIIEVLRRHRGFDDVAAGRWAALWLLNPMVATISTRGSSEGLLGVLVMALLWAVLERRVALAGALLGLGVHFKIYPFIYAPAIVWWMDDERMARAPLRASASALDKARRFVSAERIKLGLSSLVVFVALNATMYTMYGAPFVQHTFLHHVTRIDHRHNFSPYNVLLYLKSAAPDASGFQIESLAFLPQILLSTILIPLAVAKKDLATSMMAQTFAFVTFNKVCTSQYFLWYMVFLPLYLPKSSFIEKPTLGISALLLWVITQGLWLQNGYELEFLGKSTFFPGLWLSSVAFYLVNCWILGVIISDGGENKTPKPTKAGMVMHKS